MKFFAAALAILLFACNNSKKLSVANNISPKNISLNGKLFTSIFQQQAAEYRALCLQGYNVARMRIQTFSASSSKPKAIITDIDETILDNSPYAVHQAYAGKEYEAASWYGWTDKAAADTMPGAASFLQFAAAKNITIFYVTNREERERKSTLANLQKFNLPNADDAHFFPKTNSSSKELRRQNIMQQYEVVLLMGDNLADLSVMFDKKSAAERRNNVDILASDFGQKFILFPNANYGDWENSLYNFNYKFNQAQKDSVFKTVLKNY